MMCCLFVSGIRTGGWAPPRSWGHCFQPCERCHEPLTRKGAPRILLCFTCRPAKGWQNTTKWHKRSREWHLPSKPKSATSSINAGSLTVLVVKIRSELPVIS